MAAPPPRPSADAADGLVRADAARRVARRLLDVHGRPVRVLATVEAAGAVTVHLSAVAAPPPRWTAAGDVLAVPATVPTETLVGAVPDELDDPGPALVELITPEGAAVAVDVAAAGVLSVAAEVATVGVVRALVLGLLRAPAATGVDVLLSSIHPACVPAVPPHAPGRLHAPLAAADVVPLATALAGGDEPVVVVAASDALTWDGVLALRSAGVGAVLLGGAPAAWHLGGRPSAMTLTPLGLVVAPVRP